MPLFFATRRPIRIRRGYSGLFVGSVVLLLSGCVTTRVATAPDCPTPDNVSYTDTTITTYFWGLKHIDLTPPCDQRFNHLNGVTVRSTFGHYLLTTVTLGIVNKRRVRWCCAPYVPRTDSI